MNNIKAERIILSAFTLTAVLILGIILVLVAILVIILIAVLILIVILISVLILILIVIHIDTPPNLLRGIPQRYHAPIARIYPLP